MTVGLIVASSNNDVIGVNGKIPWNYPGDLKRFREITRDSVVIMGRKTWESLPKKPLPNRVNIVITSYDILYFKEKYKTNNVLVKNNIYSAICIAKLLEPNRDIWFIGGKKIYEECVQYCDIIDITKIPIEISFDESKDEVTFLKEEDLIRNKNDWAIEDFLFHPYEKKLFIRKYKKL